MTYIMGFENDPMGFKCCLMGFKSDLMEYIYIYMILYDDSMED